MKQILANHQLVLMEAAIVEALRRTYKVQLHPRLLNAPLIYEEVGSNILRKLYQSYIDIAKIEKLPLLICTPTWRANQSRVYESNVSHSINIDATQFLLELRDSQNSNKDQIKIGGMIGCKNDCYRPEESLSSSEAEQFHSWQIGQLIQSEVDFLIAETLLSVEEATGIAKAMEVTGKPYIISFVISRNAYVLDGTNLKTAIEWIDSQTNQKPLGYMVNCAYPAFLCAEKQPIDLFKRLIAYQANASSLDHCDLDNADELKGEDISEWGNLMLELNQSYGIKILGGCCGTNGEHLQYIARKFNS